MTQQMLVGLGGAAFDGLYPFDAGVQFRPQKSGRSGPSLGEIRNGTYDYNGSASQVNNWKNDTSYLNDSGGYLLWTVPATGTYRVETYGPRGGNAHSNYQGGYGTYMRGDFAWNEGQTIKMLIGQQGDTNYGGGGGMTAVSDTGNNPYIVSGGGNNTSPWNNTSVNATTSTNGTSGSYGWYGSSGQGGYSQAGTWGGAGFYGQPQGSESCGSTKGNSFTNGGQGGYSCNANGGFGGGSATDGCCYGASAAGAGYSGGAGTNTSGNYGGGGGSINNGSNQSNSQSGEQYGIIKIQYVS